MLDVLLEHPVHRGRVQLSTGRLWSSVDAHRLNERASPVASLANRSWIGIEELRNLQIHPHAEGKAGAV
jgi:hypothetical protein